MAHPLVDKYSWLTDENVSALSEAGCITCVTDSSEEAVLAAFGAVMDEPIDLAPGELPDVEAVAVATVGDAVVAVEFNGYQGSRPEVLKPASKPGSAASIFWNVNGLAQFGCARRRRLVALADLSLGEGEDELPKKLLPLMRLVEDDEVDVVPVGMAMVELYTGVDGVTPAFVNGLTRAFAVSPVVEELYVVNAQLTSLRYEYERLVDRIAAAPADVQREIAEAAASAAVRSVSLDQDPRARSVLDQFGRQRPAEFTKDAMSLLVEVEQASDRLARAHDRALSANPELYEAPEPPELRRSWMPVHAMRSLRYATHPDAESAVFGALQSARPTAPNAIADAERRQSQG